MGPARMRESLTTTPGIREQPRPTADLEAAAVRYRGEPRRSSLNSGLSDRRHGYTPWTPKFCESTLRPI